MSNEENKRIVRRYFEEFHSQRALSIADEIMSGEMREGALRLARMLTTAFPDYQLMVSDQIAEGDTVTTIWTARGTHQGDWMSPIGAIAPTGKPVTWSGSTTVRLRDGLNGRCDCYELGSPGHSAANGRGASYGASPGGMRPSTSEGGRMWAPG